MQNTIDNPISAECEVFEGLWRKVLQMVDNTERFIAEQVAEVNEICPNLVSSADITNGYVIHHDIKSRMTCKFVRHMIGQAEEKYAFNGVHANLQEFNNFTALDSKQLPTRLWQAIDEKYGKGKNRPLIFRQFAAELIWFFNWYSSTKLRTRKGFVVHSINSTHLAEEASITDKIRYGGFTLKKIAEYFGLFEKFYVLTDRDKEARAIGMMLKHAEKNEYVFAPGNDYEIIADHLNVEFKVNRINFLMSRSLLDELFELAKEHTERTHILAPLIVNQARSKAAKDVALTTG